MLVGSLDTPAAARVWALTVGAVLAFQLLLLLLNLPAVLSGANLHKLWGTANLMTLARGVLIALLAGFLLAPEPAGPAGWLPPLLYTLCAVLDLLDGWWARRTDAQTRMGALLDVELDALGILLALALAIQYRRLPPAFLVVGLARYLFAAALAVRRRAGLPVVELPPSYLRRRLAGFQMGVLAVLLWPIAAPPATTLGQALIGAPLLAGFVRDWLLATGRLDPEDPLYRRLLRVFGRIAYFWVPPLLRVLLASLTVLGLVGLFTGYPAVAGGSPAGPAGWLLTGSRLLLMAALVAGWQGSPAALLLLLLESFRVFRAGPGAGGLVVIACALLLYLLGTGPLSVGGSRAGSRKTASRGPGTRRWLHALLWLPIPLLLYWALRDVRLDEVLSVLGRLGGLRLPALLGINLLFVLILTARWAAILRAMGIAIPLSALGRYRLAGFAVSYLTPGPQFGGEPVQLLLAHRGSALEYGSGSASILLDRSFELVGNLTFLGLGAWGFAALGLVPGRHAALLFLVPAVLVLLPLLYLGGSFSGRRPLSWLLERLPRVLRERPWLSRLSRLIAAAEAQVTAFGRRPARAAGLAAVFFFLVSAVSLVEMWLALHFLGAPARWSEVLVLAAGGRFAFLLPFPGALGALEATQVSLFALLGLPAETAWALLLYTRARDLVFAAAGLLVVGIALGLKNPRGLKPRPPRRSRC